MIIGVVSFYFVVSDINTIISNSVAKGIKVSSCMVKLEKIKELYPVSQKVYSQAKKSLFGKQPLDLARDRRRFLDHFPKSFQNDLKFHIYSKQFKDFPWVPQLGLSVLGMLGDAVREVDFEESKRDQTPKCTSRTTLPRTSSFCSKGSC